MVPRPGGTVAHQDIVFNLRALLARLLAGSSLRALHEMRLRIDPRIRYPDVLVCAGPVDQTQKTLDDAVVIFEVLSDDTAATDRVEKLIDYGNVPSLQAYIMLEQASRAAIICHRAPGSAWTTTSLTEGVIPLPEMNFVLPLEEIYRGLSFPERISDRSKSRKFCNVAKAVRLIPVAELCLAGATE